MTEEINRQALTQKWIHSHEEDTDEETVFRPASYKFPPSRGRRSFEIAPDGSMIEQSIGPDDRPNPKRGSWRLNEKNELELSSLEADVRKTIMRLVRVGPDKLVAKKDP